jgi:hypothetical protein
MTLHLGMFNAHVQSIVFIDESAEASKGTYRLRLPFHFLDQRQSQVPRRITDTHLWTASNVVVMAATNRPNSNNDSVKSWGPYRHNIIFPHLFKCS